MAGKYPELCRNGPAITNFALRRIAAVHTYAQPVAACLQVNCSNCKNRRPLLRLFIRDCRYILRDVPLRRAGEGCSRRHQPVAQKAINPHSQEPLAELAANSARSLPRQRIQEMPMMDSSHTNELRASRLHRLGPSQGRRNANQIRHKTEQQARAGRTSG